MVRKSWSMGGEYHSVREKQIDFVEWRSRVARCADESDYFLSAITCSSGFFRSSAKLSESAITRSGLFSNIWVEKDT